MSRGGIEIVVALFDVFPVVALVPSETEEALFENGILAIPQRRGKAQSAFAIGPPIEPVLAPAVNTRARVIVWKLRPAMPVWGIIFPHRPPLSLAQIWPPSEPILCALAVLDQPLLFDGHVLVDSVRK